MQAVRYRRGARLVLALVLCATVAGTLFADDGPISVEADWPPPLVLNRLEGHSPQTDPITAATDLPLKRPVTQPGPGPASRQLTTSAWKTAGALALVCLGVFGVARLLRRNGRGLWKSRLPVEAIEVLGQRPLDTRNSLRLVRCGSRLLVLSVSATGGLSTLSEITDPDEVKRLVDLCRQTPRRPHGRAVNNSIVETQGDGQLLETPRA